MSKISKFQKFEAVTIDRNEIKNAPYNPRKISEPAQKALRKSLKTHGLVETIIFNVQTGNLVGGHQRLSQLDALEGGIDYKITVAKVDLPLKQEKELNIALNNPNLQGTYDMDMLKDIFPDIDIDNTGFDEYDLSIMGIDEDVAEIAKTQKTKQEIQDDIDAIKKIKADTKEKNVGHGENYVVVTFGSVEAKESFLDYLGHEVDDRYIKGEILLGKLNLDEKELVKLKNRTDV